jgi:hypothetical protein
MLDHLKTLTSKTLLDGQNRVSADINELAMSGKLSPEDQKQALQLLGQLMTLNSEITIFFGKFADKKAVIPDNPRTAPDWLTQRADSQEPLLFKAL